jgi:Flp pilus assembly protein TadG
MKKRYLVSGKHERGQSFMELAISLLFLLILLAAVIDLGWAFYTMVALRDTAQEAAAFGSMCPDKLNLVQTRLLQSATAPINMSDLQSGDIEICIVGSDPSTQPALFACVAGATPAVRGNNVRVSLRIQHQILTPFVGSFIGTQTYPLTVTVSNTILVDKCATTN